LNDAEFEKYWLNPKGKDPLFGDFGTITEKKRKRRKYIVVSDDSD
jgi:hypothetical protein